MSGNRKQMLQEWNIIKQQIEELSANRPEHMTDEEKDEYNKIMKVYYEMEKEGAR